MGGTAGVAVVLGAAVVGAGAAFAAGVAAQGSDAPARVLLDVPYVADAHARQRIDLYLPEGEGWPTLVFVHGGSLQVGDRKGDSIPAVCSTFARHGVGCASVGYRLFDDTVSWPAPAEDVAAAFAWLHGEIAGLRGAPERVYLGGHSSGCVLSSVVGTGAYLETHDLGPQDVAGIVAMGCRLAFPFDTIGVPRAEMEAAFERERGYGSLAARLDAAPINHLSADLPRMLILIAEAERLQPPIEADAREYIARALRLGAREPTVRILPDRRHYTALHRMAEPGDPTLRLILDFVSNGPGHVPVRAKRPLGGASRAPFTEPSRGR